MSDKYATYKAAQESGGPCPICDWRDGDGTRTCFYDSTYGVVRHQNSDAAVLRSMSPEQASLYSLRQELLYIDPEAREKDLERVRRERDRARREGKMANTEAEEAAWWEQHCAEKRAEPTAQDEPYQSWIQREWWIPRGHVPDDLVYREKTDYGQEWAAFMVHCYEPHPGCGGRQEGVGPYHIRCTRCGVEVKLWEHGVDYDLG